MYKLLPGILLFSLLALPMSAFSHGEEDHEHVDEAEIQQTESGTGWRLVRSVELGDSGKLIRLVLVDHAVHTDKTIYSAAINRLCTPGDDFCRIRFWSEEKYVPEKASLTVEQNKHLKADYLVNKSAGMQHLRWSCSVNPDKNNCF
ncbi:MAG: hypothetical protein LZF61_09985 [Nitrosomonas sp.]|nr:MAG: hypothetical protein LZF61_09985 [Nitrosomonas sp.]